MTSDNDNPFSGDWTYRSFKNLPEEIPNTNSAPLSVILFGQGDLHLEADGKGGFDGSTLSFGPGFSMSVSGESEPGGDAQGHERPPSIRMRAVGVPGTKTDGWIYDYSGYLAQTWPNGVEQRAAIVGTVIRVVPHNGRPAGVVASFVAVKRD